MRTFKVIYLVLLLLFVSCPEQKEEEPVVDLASEQEAKKLVNDAESLWGMGNKVGALKVYSSMAKKYPNTETKKKAEMKLKSLGLSIDNPLMSFTVLTMVDYENKIIAYFQSYGKFPGERTIGNPTDAWGEKIYVKFYKEKPQYDFIIFSNGPDRKKKTDDDLAIVHAPEDRMPVTKAPMSDISTEDLSSMEHVYDDESKSTDDSATMDQMKQMEDSSSGPMEMSLQELEKFGN